MSKYKHDMGYYIEFEGIDASGKSSLMDAVNIDLQNRRVLSWATREPGSPHDKVTTAIRDLFKSGLDIDPLAEVYLFAADRAQHLRKVVMPMLNRGATVLQDRGIWSTVAYQGYGRGVSMELIVLMNKLLAGTMPPDLIIWVDTPVETAADRLKTSRNDEIHRFNQLTFQEKVYKGYLDLFNKKTPELFYADSPPVVRLDGRRSLAELKADAVAAILNTAPYTVGRRD